MSDDIADARDTANARDLADARDAADARDLARLTAVQDALHKVQEQAAAFEELGERLSLSVHMLEAEVAGLAREMRARQRASADAPPSAAARVAPPSEAAAPSVVTEAGAPSDVLVTNGDVEPAARGRSADVDGARLVALNMALTGEPREATGRYLDEHYAIDDPQRLLDEVYAVAPGAR
jgi:hypothetical protein